MEKSKIFIASSGRTLVLAEKLRDELHTDFCEATLWSDVGKSRPGATIVEMLENAAVEHDFAVIILARDDVVSKDASDAGVRKARDNCVFEAGLFMAALGRERCFLANSVEQRDLPSDLSGVISIPFKEPANLASRDASAQAIRTVSAVLKDAVQRLGRAPARRHASLLSVDEVFSRERPQSEGGDLREGQIVVCDVQPMTRPDLAIRIRHNLDHGVSYLYFLHGSEDTVEKVLQLLQVALVTDPATEDILDFRHRTETVLKEKTRVLDELERICEMRSLRISFLPEEPTTRFRIHNASDRELARLYMKFRGQWYVPWEEGSEAVKVWQQLPRYFAPATEKCLFVRLKEGIDLEESEKRLVENAVNRALARYFPGIEDEVKRLCYGSTLPTADGRSRRAKA